MSSDKNLDEKATNKNKNINSENWIIKIIPSHTKEIISAIIIGVIITVFSAIIMSYFFSNVEPDENSMYAEEFSQVETAGATHRIYFIQAQLSTVLAVISPLKIQIIMYFQTMGELPSKKEDIQLESFDLEEYEQIESAYLTSEGGIGVHLSEIFDEDKYVALLPQASTSGAFIKWRCVTNIDERYLGIPKNRICEFQEK